MINSFNDFDTLKEVWLGDCYPTDFYYDFDSDVKHAFELITEITQEDLYKIQNCLENLGVIVHRPEFTNNREDYVNDNGFLIKPPIMPRDTDMVLGKEFFHLRSNYKIDPWKDQIFKFKQNNVVVHEARTNNDLSCIAPPSIVRCGKDLYVDFDTHEHVWPMVSSTLVEWAKKYRVHINYTGGHSDGVFCLLQEGLIITSCYKDTYTKTFPGWEIFQLPKENVQHFQNWWIDDNTVTNNAAFANHINQFALDWVGNYTETQFSVNMLVVDEKTVLSVTDNVQLNEFLDKKGINVIPLDFRAKSFWDGGLHCLTTDILREGECKNYFPERTTNNYLEWIE